MDDLALRRLRMSLRPPWMLAVAVTLSGVTAGLIITGHRSAGGIAALAGAMMLSASADRALGAGGRPELAYHLADRLFDASILGPVAWHAHGESDRLAVLALVGLGAAFVASYERARGRSLGYAGAETVPHRVASAALLVLALLTGLVEGFLWGFAVLSVTAAAVRGWSIVAQDRDAGAKAVREGHPE